MKKFLTFAFVAALSVAAAVAQHSTFYYQRTTLFDVLPPVDSTNIVMLGNSITNGCEWHELLGDSRVVNRGISGDIVQGVRDRLSGITAGKPAAICLMIGVNDVSHHLTADSIATSIDSLLGEIQKETPSTKIILQSCLPIKQTYDRFHGLDGEEQTIRDINTQLEGIARRRGIDYLNLYPLLADSDGNLDAKYTNDGLHLLGPAYLVWADALRPLLKGL